MGKIKLLVHSDFVCTTGFGTVARNIVSNLDATGDFDIDVVGINYDGDPYDLNEWKGTVYPAVKTNSVSQIYMDVFGRQRVLDLLAEKQHDVLLIIQDTFVIKDYAKALIQTCKNTGTKIVFYYPIDATPHPSWITDVVSKVDYPVTYTEYAKRETLKVDPSLEEKLKVIYHGTNTQEFNVVPDEGFRKHFFGPLADKFIIMNLNRNQPRKDIFRSLLVAKELKERGRNTLLYLHMQGSDVGGDIKQWADQLGLEYGKDYIFPENIGQGYPVHLINLLYNAVDCVLTTTHGEGWGLSITEAMATKTPVIAPDVTSISEILANNRGILVPSGITNDDWYTLGHSDNNRLRPLMNVEMAASAVDSLLAGELPDMEGAYAWAVSQDWSTKAKEFEAIIRKAAEKPVFTPNREQRRKMAKAKR